MTLLSKNGFTAKSQRAQRKNFIRIPERGILINVSDIKKYTYCFCPLSLLALALIAIDYDLESSKIGKRAISKYKNVKISSKKVGLKSTNAN